MSWYTLVSTPVGGGSIIQEEMKMLLSRDELKETAMAMLAYLEGKPVQVYVKKFGEWVDAKDGSPCGRKV